MLYAAITVEENGKYSAFLDSFTSATNVKSFVEKYPTMSAMNVFTVKKTAKEVVDAWNKSYQENGNYMY